MMKDNILLYLFADGGGRWKYVGLLFFFDVVVYHHLLCRPLLSRPKCDKKMMMERKGV